MKQLDWIEEHYQVPSSNVKGLYIWYRDDWDADLWCEFLGMEGNIISFYVINGGWKGELDVVNKTLYIIATDKTYPYHKFEFTYNNLEEEYYAG